MNPTKHKYTVGDVVQITDYFEPMQIINVLYNDTDGDDYCAVELSVANNYTPNDFWHFPESDIIGLYEPNDPINPNHYKTNNGIECIDIAQHFIYTMGNAIKYIWRAGLKDDLIQDLNKAIWYLNKAIENGDDIYLTPRDENLIQRKRKQLNPNDFNRYPHQKAILDMLLLTDVEQAKEYLEEIIQRLKEQPK